MTSKREYLTALRGHILGRRTNDALSLVQHLIDEEMIREARSADTHVQLLQDLQTARALLWEANLGMMPIYEARADAAKQALIDAGYEVPAW